MDPATGSARAARDCTVTPDEDVRGEASRLEARLTVARDRIRALLPRHVVWSPESAGGGAPRAGVARFDDDDVDPALRELLGPAASRVSRLLEVAGSLSDGTLTDAAAAEAARRIAAEQPHRRSR